MKILILLYILSTYYSFGQNIKGLIVDKDSNKPLVGAHVFLKNKKDGVISNSIGEFELVNNLKVSEYDTIFFSHIGYAPKKISFLELKESKHVVYLSIAVQQLEKVSVLSKEKLKPKIQFNKLSSLKVGIHSFGSTLIGDKIYVIGGDKSFISDEVKKELSLDRYADPERSLVDIINNASLNWSWQNYNGKLYIYDILLDTWDKSRLEFRKRAYNNINFYNNKIYILGGKRLSNSRYFEYLDNKIEVFDLNDNTVLIDDVNPHQAIDFASFIKDENLIVLGGSTKLNKNKTKQFSNKVHILDMESGLWFELADMPRPKETQGVLINETIFLIGGFNKYALKEIESFDLKTGRWKIEGKLFSSMKRPALTYHDNMIYIFENGKILTYNVVTKELKEFLIGLFLRSSELFYKNDKLYLLGGYKQDEFTTSPSSNLFSINVSEFLKTRINNSTTF